MLLLLSIINSAQRLPRHKLHQAHPHRHSRRCPALTPRGFEIEFSYGKYICIDLLFIFMRLAEPKRIDINKNFL